MPPPADRNKSNGKGRRRFFTWTALALVVFGVVAAVSGVLAYRLDPQHFRFHILTEVAVASATLLLTVVLVEGLLEGRRVRDRREQWEVIRESTLKWMAASTWGLVSASARLLSDGPEVARFMSLTAFRPTPPTAAGVAALNELAAAVDRRLAESGRVATPAEPGQPGRPGQAAAFDPPAFLHWFRFTQRRRQALIDVVVPRVMQFAPDHPAMKLLLEVEELIMWMDGLEEGLEGSGATYAAGYSGSAAALILKCAKIYEALVEDRGAA